PDINTIDGTKMLIVIQAHMVLLRVLVNEPHPITRAWSEFARDDCDHTSPILSLREDTVFSELS
ncbi:MAG: hypothetical protein N3D16_04950, partial [Anaerolineales bacterium]|nr:hypothetical protein [Anaerolineales bacterium]